MVTTTPLPRLPMTKALKALFESQFASAGMPVGLMAAPKVPETVGSPRLILAQPPYWILHPLWTTTSGPPLFDPNADAVWNYQASAYSIKGDQIEWMLDHARPLIVGKDAAGGWLHPLVIAGMHVMDRALSEDIGVDPNGSEGVHDAVLRFAISVTPDYP